MDGCPRTDAFGQDWGDLVESSVTEELSYASFIAFLVVWLQKPSACGLLPEL